jgi:predicted esterase
MDEFIAKSPRPWKGAILLNPIDLPDFSKSPQFQPRPKILISSGSEEHQEARIKKYQADALNYGAVVEFIIHPGENHTLVGNAAQLSRTQAIMRFIFEE